MTNAVYAFHKVHIRYIRQNHPQVTGIKYFSDGSYAQYTNHLNFSNFYHHKDDFGFSAEWIFVAKSLEKGTCDGYGVVVKYLATCYSKTLAMSGKGPLVNSWTTV